MLLGKMPQLNVFLSCCYAAFGSHVGCQVDPLNSCSVNLSCDDVIKLDNKTQSDAINDNRGQAGVLYSHRSQAKKVGDQSDSVLRADVTD